MISSFLSKTLFKVAYEFSNKSEKKTNALMANEFYQQKILKLDVWNLSIKGVTLGSFPRASRL